jgi:hypothetical protein
MATSTRRTAPKTAPSRKSPARAARKSPARKKAAPAPAAEAIQRAAAKAASPAPTKPAKPATAASQQAPAEPKKLKLVRDSFTLPKVEYGVIDILKTRAARLARPAKKSEIVRAGLKALIAMSDADFLACVSSLPAAKPKGTAKG